jgi:hypothetical protein
MLDDVRSAIRDLFDRRPMRRGRHVIGRLLKSWRGCLFLVGIGLIVLTALELPGHAVHAQLEVLEGTLSRAASLVATWLRSTTLLALPADFLAAAVRCVHDGNCVERLSSPNGLSFAFNGGLAALDAWRSGVAEKGGPWAGIAAGTLLAGTALGLWWGAKFRWDFGSLGVILIVTPFVAMLAGYAVLGLAELVALVAGFIVRLMLLCAAAGVCFTIAGFVKDVFLARGELKELLKDDPEPAGTTAPEE